MAKAHTVNGMKAYNVEFLADGRRFVYTRFGSDAMVVGEFIAKRAGFDGVEILAIIPVPVQECGTCHHCGDTLEHTGMVVCKGCGYVTYWTE